MKVLIADKIADEGIELLEEKGFDVAKAWDEPKEKLPDMIKDYDAIVIRSATKVRKDMIDKAENLKVVGRAGIGLDNVDKDYAEEKGIAVRNTPAATTYSVAELTMTHILAAHRDIVAGTVATKEGKWVKKQLKGHEVYGKTLGILGIGRIGYALADRAKAFGMKVLGYRRHPKDHPGVENVDFDTLLGESDIISVHSPLTPETKHILDKEAFEKMKDGVIVLNISRGGIIDEDALYEAMKSGKVKAACLDSFEEEPPVGNKLLELDNLFVTPHIGGQTYEGQTRAGVQVAEAVIEELEK